MKKVNKNVIFYLVFSVIMFGVFLYLRFPGQAVESYLLQRFMESYPAASLSLESVNLSFPPGLELKKIMLSFNNIPSATIRLDRFQVRPRLLGYLSGKSSFLVNAAAYGGLVKGVVSFPFFFNPRQPDKIEITFEDLDLKQARFIGDKFGGQVTGKLGGALQYSGETDVNFTIQKGSFQLENPMYGFNRLDFSKIEGQANLKNQVLKISKLTMNGSQIGATLKGNITLKSDLTNSEINLSGTVSIVSLNNKKIPVLVTGTIGNAGIRYL